jgi:DNA-binding XRE family transcriptional regulator
MRTDTVTMTRAEYEALIERLEDAEDALEVREVEARPESHEYFPVEVLDRLLAGDHPLRVWREYRGLTMQQLSSKADVPQSYVSEIETGKKPGSVAALKSLAEVLELTIDDLVP